MSRFTILDTPLESLKVVQRIPVGDNRGFLERMFCADELQSLMGGRQITQVNRTLTARRGTVRGLHFQHPPCAEIKAVSCLRGEVFDVAVDLRRNSPTFLSWHAEILSADNHKTMWIPELFAHGFQTLADDCELLYLHTAPYTPHAEGGLHARDVRLGIRWPEPLSELSLRDSAHPMLTEELAGVPE